MNFESRYLVKHLPSSQMFVIAKPGKAAPRGVISIKTPDEVSKAKAELIKHNISQLVVFSETNALVGIISWASIGKITPTPEIVSECVVDISDVKLSLDADFRDAIKIVKEYGAVVVVDELDKLVGLITGSDIAEQYQILAEPFVLLGDIEESLRLILLSQSSEAKIIEFVMKDSKYDRKVENIKRLTFWDLIYFLQNKEHWAEINCFRDISRKDFCGFLQDANTTRNEIFHFRKTKFDNSTLDTLKSVREQLLNILGEIKNRGE